MPKSTSMDWHRQQHKKQLKKNKEARIAARDEKVKSEKTVQQVQEEIRAIERQFKNKDAMPHPIKNKLDRLKKELKLVQDVEQKKPKPPEWQQRHQQKRAFQPLANPQLSVYYDPIMNPYGEPPPGKPRLFYTRDGGVTMNLEEAALPGSVPPPPPPPPLSRGGQQHYPPHHQRYSRSDKTDSFSHAKHNKNQNAYPHGHPAHPEQQPPPPPPPIESDPSHIVSKVKNHNVLPQLPEPSAAVKRSKRKLNADIWASSEEIEYETTMTGESALEGVGSSVSGDQWWYKDTANNIQGPFSAEQMIQWVQVGFFPTETPVRATPEASWQTLRKVKLFRSVLPDHLKEPQHSAALSSPTEEEAPSPLHDRIAALRRQEPIRDVAALDEEEEEDESECESDQDDSIQARIAALRNDNNRKVELEEFPASDFTKQVDANNGSTQLGITQQRPEREFEVEATPSVGGEQSPSSDHNPVAFRHGLVGGDRQYEDEQLVETHGSGSDRGCTADSNPSYPVDQHFDVQYPVDENYDVQYPVDEDHDVAYQVDDLAADAYPVDDYDVPAIGAYPLDGDVAEAEPYDDGEISSGQDQLRKKLKISKDLVAFIPSHLRKARTTNT